MKKFISFNTAINLSLVIFGLFVVFHLSIIIGIVFFDYVPKDFLWGGRMDTKEQLLGFEVVSLLIMIFCIFIVLIKSKQMLLPKLYGLANIAVWLLFLLFLLNTAGNIFAKTTFEKFFAIVTALLSFLSLRIALEKKSEHK